MLLAWTTRAFVLKFGGLGMYERNRIPLVY